MSDYQSFLATKTRRPSAIGFDVSDSDVNQALFPFQRDLVRFAIRLGRTGVFAATGLGKTLIMMDYSRLICEETRGKALIVAPLAVAHQTRQLGTRFGISSTVCRENSDVRPGINITNYERIHKFDCSQFDAVALDENMLKSYMGKIKRLLIDSFARTRFKLSCTATPSPNNLLEIGNQSEFLGIMDSNEMIARWFSNDTMKMGSYHLKPHAARDFWRWLASWGVMIEQPEDLGHNGSAFVLPELRQEIIELSSENCPAPEGFLFHCLDVSATTMHKVKRATSSERARAVANLVNATERNEPFLIWCDTNYEADEIRPLIDDAVEVRGSDSIDEKEGRLRAFAENRIHRLISKPEIAGLGLNLQHCNKMVFMGVSFSFERYYQAVRRCWRFGQTRPVTVYVVNTDAESSVLKTVLAKESAFAEMKAEMINAVREDQLESVYGNRRLVESNGAVQVQVPNWLRSHQ